MRTSCARSATPRNAGWTRRSWSGCWWTGAGSPSRSAASRATRPRPPPCCRSSRRSRPGTPSRGWWWSPTPGCSRRATCKELDEAGLRFIVGSRVTKAPTDLASHFRWHGDAFTDGQVIDTITPRHANRRSRTTPSCKPEPMWDPGGHPGSWRAVWAYSAKRAARDAKTLTLQENRAKAVIAGEKATRRPRFVKDTGAGDLTLDEASLARARSLVGLKGYVTNIPATVMPAERGHRQLPRPVEGRAVVPDVQDRPTRPADVPPHPRGDRGPPDHRGHRPRRRPRGPAPDRALDPQPRPPAPTPALSHHRDQRRRADPRHPRSTPSGKRSSTPSTQTKLTH